MGTHCVLLVRVVVTVERMSHPVIIKCVHYYCCSMGTRAD